MSPAELHIALREVVAIGRRGGYDNDEIAEKLSRVVRDYAADALREAADYWEGPGRYLGTVMGRIDLCTGDLRIRADAEKARPMTVGIDPLGTNRFAALADDLDYYASKTTAGTYAGGLSDAAAKIRQVIDGTYLSESDES